MLNTARKYPLELVESTAVRPIGRPPAEIEEPRSFWERAALAATVLVTFPFALLVLFGL